jgi:CRP-like cAMP-binding protein
MDPGAFDRLRSHLTAVVLQRRDVLQEHNRPIDYVYFIERGVASLFARTRRDGPVEVAMVGRLGFVGVAVVLGTMRSPNRALMGVPGEALRIASHELRRAMDDCPGIRNRLLTYVHALLIQNTQTALCNARHEIEERLCRWLLLASDRLDEHVIPLTHEMLSMILGVRRAGVTETLSHLERVGAVKKARGAIEIVDRAILEQRTCECYRIITSEYRHLINSGQHEHVIELGSRALDRVKR